MTDSSAAFRFDAFISYSHAADGQLAPALQSGLEQLGRPWYRLRALRVFRDKTGLGLTEQLWGSIQTSIRQSGTFVLLASPAAARSAWVEREILAWRETKRNLILVVTDGQVQLDARDGCFASGSDAAIPAGLKGRYLEEPLFLDLRWARGENDLSLGNPRFRDAVALIASTIRGIEKQEFDSEAALRYRRNRQAAYAAIVSLVLLAGAALWFGYCSRVAERVATEAEGAERRAKEVALAAERAAKRQAAQVLSERGRELEATPLEAAAYLIEAYRLDPADLATRFRLPDAVERALTLKLTLEAHSEGVTSACFSPDGERIVTGSSDRTAELWSSRDGAHIALLPGHDGPVESVAFSSDGSRIVTASEDATARLWDGRTGRWLATLSGHTAALTQGKFSSTGDRIVTASEDGTARIWDGKTGQLLVTLVGHQGAVCRPSSREMRSS